MQIMVNEQPRLTRDVRRAALQTIYQFDATSGDDPSGIRASLEGSSGDESVHERGYELGAAAWNNRAAADERVAPLTPKWPVHRQPIVDRSILRLAVHEMFELGTPPKVVINEAVELAREFSTERSPMFVNGVLDKLFREHFRDAPGDDESESTDDADQGVEPSTETNPAG